VAQAVGAVARLRAQHAFIARRLAVVKDSVGSLLLRLAGVSLPVTAPRPSLAYVAAWVHPSCPPKRIHAHDAHRCLTDSLVSFFITQLHTPSPLVCYLGALPDSSPVPFVTLPSLPNPHVSPRRPTIW
jgi:hypothetical protein